MRALMQRLSNWSLGPVAMARLHLIATLVFLLLIPPSIFLWKNSVPYLVGISVWANFAGHLSAWQAARVEIRQEASDGDD